MTINLKGRGKSRGYIKIPGETRRNWTRHLRVGKIQGKSRGETRRYEERHRETWGFEQSVIRRGKERRGDCMLKCLRPS